MGKSNPARTRRAAPAFTRLSTKAGVGPTGATDVTVQPSPRTAEAAHRFFGETLQSAWIRMSAKVLLDVVIPVPQLPFRPISRVCNLAFQRISIRRMSSAVADDPATSSTET